MQRFFLVGTARAGTTLLQSMIGSHSEVFTLPETHFWDKSMPKQPLLRLFRVLGEGDRQRIRLFLASVGSESLAGSLPQGLIWSKTRWSKALLQTLDALAEQRGKAAWLEKTPLHLYYTDHLRRVDPSVRFVHIIREPVDNIASLLDAGQHHGEAFRQNTLDKAIRRWKKEYRLQCRQLGKPGHAFVRYEDLVQHPEPELRRLLDFMELTWQEGVLEYADRSASITTAQESWKDRNKGALKRSEKAAKILTPEQRMTIEHRTKCCPTHIFVR